MYIHLFLLVFFHFSRAQTKQNRNIYIYIYISYFIQHYSMNKTIIHAGIHLKRQMQTPLSSLAAALVLGFGLGRVPVGLPAERQVICEFNLTSTCKCDGGGETVCSVGVDTPPATHHWSWFWTAAFCCTIVIGVGLCIVLLKLHGRTTAAVADSDQVRQRLDIVARARRSVSTSRQLLDDVDARRRDTLRITDQVR